MQPCKATILQYKFKKNSHAHIQTEASLKKKKVFPKTAALVPAWGPPHRLQGKLWTCQPLSLCTFCVFVCAYERVSIYSLSRTNIHVHVQTHVCLCVRVKMDLSPLSHTRPCVYSTSCVFNPVCVCMCVWKCICSLSCAHVHVCIQPHVCLCVHVKTYPFPLSCSHPCACSDSDPFPCSSPWLSFSQLTPCIAPASSVSLLLWQLHAGGTHVSPPARPAAQSVLNKQVLGKSIRILLPYPWA